MLSHAPLIRADVLRYGKCWENCTFRYMKKFSSCVIFSSLLKPTGNSRKYIRGAYHLVIEIPVILNLSNLNSINFLLIKISFQIREESISGIHHVYRIQSTITDKKNNGENKNIRNKLVPIKCLEYVWVHFEPPNNIPLLTPSP